MKNSFNEKKMNEQFSEALHFEHLIAKKSVNFQAKLIPEDYSYLIANYDEEVLKYYRLNKMLFLMEQKEDINKILLSFLNNFSQTQLHQLITKIKFSSVYEKLLKKRSMTYSIDFDRTSDAHIPTASMLKIYADKYETEEMLVVWRWITNLANNQPLAKKFPLNTFGKINKTRLIKDIIRDLSNYPTIKNIFKIAYNFELRHAINHHNEYLDNESKYIVDLDSNEDVLSYEKFFETFYSIQQIDNITTLFIDLKSMDTTNLFGKGIIGSFTLIERNGTRHLILLQLNPFYENDISYNMEIKSVKISFEEDKFQIFSDDKIIHSMLVDQDIIHWFLKYPTTITLVSCTTNISNNIPFNVKNRSFQNLNLFLNPDKVYIIPIETVKK